MEFRASHRYARMGVRKARLVIDLVRGRSASQALDTLANDRHRAAGYIRKVLASAVADALQNPEVRASRLVVSEAFANEGPLLQNRMRFRPSAMGRALPFRRRTCHIHIKVDDPGVTAEVEVETDTPDADPVEDTLEEAVEDIVEVGQAEETGTTAADEETRKQDKEKEDKE